MEKKVGTTTRTINWAERLNTKSRVIAIVGSTASGKTDLSLRIAEKIKGEIISADSRQIYRGLDIGTAKPSKEVRAKIPHHFIDILDPDEDYSAGEYGQEARKKINELLSNGRVPIIVGGSGLYIKALVDGLFEGPAKNKEIREQLEDEAKRYGKEMLYEKLKKIDPISASRMDFTKLRRIIRALEVYYITGKPISELHSSQQTRPEFDVVQYGIEWDRNILYERINKRVDAMFEKGLVDEVKTLKENGYSPALNSLNTVGYKEVFDMLEGKLNEKDARELIKRNTRRYAKRQLTWFRADKRIHWIKISDAVYLDIDAEKIINEFLANHEA